MWFDFFSSPSSKLEFFSLEKVFRFFPFCLFLGDLQKIALFHSAKSGVCFTTNEISRR